MIPVLDDITMSLNQGIMNIRRTLSSDSRKAELLEMFFIHCRNRFSLTPIFYAAQNGHNDVLKVLLKAGADPGVQDTNKAGFYT